VSPAILDRRKQPVRTAAGIEQVAFFRVRMFGERTQPGQPTANNQGHYHANQHETGKPCFNINIDAEPTNNKADIYPRQNTQHRPPEWQLDVAYVGRQWTPES